MLPQFWRQFEDPLLERLVTRALQANHDLRIADARLAESRALRRDARLRLEPSLTTTAGWTKTRVDQANAVALGGVRERDTYGAGFDLAWELDLFGRLRRDLEAQSAEMGSALAARRAVSVSVTSEVARNYFELRGLQLRREVAERNIANQRARLQLTEVRLDAGRGSELDVARARAQLDSTLATVPAIDTALVAARHRLAVLTGQAPSALDTELLPAAPLPALPAFVGVGSPGEWLRRRPDIAGAERDLAAATARIGVATAELFPRVSFVGSLGSTAAEFGSLGESGTGWYTLLPGIRWGALDLRRVQAQIAASEAVASRALARYEQVVLAALEETQNALTAYRNAVDRERALARAAVASRRAAELAKLRFEEGAADFLTVLDAERTVLEAEDGLAQAQTESGTRLVGLYKTLGSGWDPADDPPLRRMPLP